MIHAIRRNVDITHVVHNNQIYGLTKGQGSPTTARGQKNPMQPEGTTSDPLNPLTIAIAAGCGFVARSFSGDSEHLVTTIKEAINYRGYALVDVLQPCVIFNRVNTFKWYRDRVYKLDSSYSPGNKLEALKKSLEWGDDGIALGVIYREERDTFVDRNPHLKNGPALVERVWKPKDAERFMEEFR